jgi:hypothetical protein
MPEIDSIRDDFPALWLPMTAINGRSISVCTLTIDTINVNQGPQTPLRENSYPVLRRRLTRSSIALRLWVLVGSERPTPLLLSAVTVGEPKLQLLKPPRESADPIVILEDADPTLGDVGGRTVLNVELMVVNGIVIDMLRG